VEGSFVATLKRRLAVARDTYRFGGARAVVLRALPLLGYRRIILFEAPLTTPVPTPPPEIPLEFDFVRREELHTMAPFRLGVPVEEIERRHDRGERGFVARYQGEVVSAIWVRSDNVTLDEVGYEVVLPEDAVYVGDAFTVPAMRGRHVAPALSGELKKRLAAEGYEGWVFYVRAGNAVGLRNATRGAARETGRVAAVKLGPLGPMRVPYLPRRKRTSTGRHRAVSSDAGSDRPDDECQDTGEEAEAKDAVFAGAGDEREERDQEGKRADQCHVAGPAREYPSPQR
jgi:hypothetical protein